MLAVGSYFQTIPQNIKIKYFVFIYVNKTDLFNIFVYWEYIRKHYFYVS